MHNVRTSPAAAPSTAQSATVGAVTAAISAPLIPLPNLPHPSLVHAPAALAAAGTSSSSASAASLDWRTIDLVIFDVDGTLYDQRKLRRAMFKLLLQHAWQTRSLDTLLTLRTFRQVREALGNQPGADFLRLQYAQTASRRGKTPTEVREMTFEWMESRPLALLKACRYPHVAELFAGLRAAGKQIAVFSDYPAGAKLVALGLNNIAPASTPAAASGRRADPEVTEDAADLQADSSDFGDFWKPGELDDPDEASKPVDSGKPAQRTTVKSADSDEREALEIEFGKASGKASGNASGSSPGLGPASDPDLPRVGEMQPIGPIVCATDPDIARLKPDPAGLLAILRLTGVAPGRALMIGDRFDRDALAAERAGVRCLIRGRKPLAAGAHPRAQTFDAYDDPLFKPVLPG